MITNEINGVIYKGKIFVNVTRISYVLKTFIPVTNQTVYQRVMFCSHTQIKNKTILVITFKLLCRSI